MLGGFLRGKVNPFSVIYKCKGTLCNLKQPVLPSPSSPLELNTLFIFVRFFRSNSQLYGYDKASR